MEIKGDIVIQDIAIDSKDRIYILWGCKGTEKGMQVDMFSDDGILLSEFSTAIKPFYDIQKILIGINRDFYVINRLGEPKIYKLKISIK